MPTILILEAIITMKPCYLKTIFMSTYAAIISINANFGAAMMSAEESNKFFAAIRKFRFFYLAYLKSEVCEFSLLGFRKLDYKA